MNTDNNENKQWFKSFNWYAFPYPILVVFAYLIIGFAFNLWHPTWLLFLTIPLYYTLIAAFKNNNWYAFPYPILVVAVYLGIGVFFDIWHPTWLLFLTIPVYYTMIALSRAKTFKAKANIFPYPILCVLFYLSVGFDYNWWHPTWLLFLTIPLYYTLITAFRDNNWYVFPYPILVITVYLGIGIFFDIWHPTWLLILTIPVYYTLIAMSRAKTFKAKANIFPYPILCVIFFLSIGLDYNIWHPTWLLFLTIPVYYMFVNSIKSK